MLDIEGERDMITRKPHGGRGQEPIWEISAYITGEILDVNGGLLMN